MVLVDVAQQLACNWGGVRVIKVTSKNMRPRTLPVAGKASVHIDWTKCPQWSTVDDEFWSGAGGFCWREIMAHLVPLHPSYHTTTAVARLTTAASPWAADVTIPSIWQHGLQSATTGADNTVNQSNSMKRGCDWSNFPLRASSRISARRMNHRLTHFYLIRSGLHALLDIIESLVYVTQMI
jgi:hypothetical protein